jgi:hypothetical protein
MGSDESQAAYNFIWDNQWRKKPNLPPGPGTNGWYYEAWVPQIVAMAQKGCYPGGRCRSGQEVQVELRPSTQETPKATRR